jgi:hypothetical protein
MGTVLVGPGPSLDGVDHVIPTVSDLLKVVPELAKPAPPPP